MRRLLLVLLAALALAGCATQPRYGYHDGEADYYYGATYDYVPDYIAHGAYYDALWPIYHNYYDPFYAPGFYYGVTWFPTNWFGFGGRRGYPYWAYSPWRNSWYDGYYDWAYWQHRQRPGRSDWHRFGSPRAESAAIASMRRDAVPASSMRRFTGDAPARRAIAERDAYPERGRTVGDSPLRNRGDIQGQVPTRGTADRYYGMPRAYSGEGPRRDAAPGRRFERDASTPVGGRDFGPASRSPGRYNDTLPMLRETREPMSREPLNRADRAWRQPTPPLREAAMPQTRYAPDRSGPAQRSAPADRAPMMRSAPIERAPMMRSAPIERSAPSPAMRSAPSAPSRSAAPPSRSRGDADR